MVDFLLDNTLGAWHAGKVLAANPKLAETEERENKSANPSYTIARPAGHAVSAARVSRKTRACYCPPRSPSAP